MKKYIIWISVACFFLYMPFAHSQSSIKELIDSYVDQNAAPFLQPVNDLSTGAFHTGLWEFSPGGDKFFVRLKIQGMISVPTDDMRTFTGVTTGDFHPQRTVTASTIIGEKNNIILFDSTGNVYAFPGGYDLQQVVSGAPQITIGGVLNTEVSGRFLSITFDNEIGRTSLAGFGVRHELTGWLEKSPVDFSVGYFYHHLKAENYLDGEYHLISAQLGKTGQIFSGHIGLSRQMSNTALDYIYEDGEEEIPIHVSLQNRANWIAEAGIGIKLGPIFTTGTISHSDFTTYAVSAGLQF